MRNTKTKEVSFVMKNDMYIEVSAENGKTFKTIKVVDDGVCDWAALGDLLRNNKDNIVLNSLCAATLLEIISSTFVVPRDEDVDDKIADLIIAAKFEGFHLGFQASGDVGRSLIEETNYDGVSDLKEILEEIRDGIV